MSEVLEFFDIPNNERKLTFFVCLVPLLCVFRSVCLKTSNSQLLVKDLKTLIVFSFFFKSYYHTIVMTLYILSNPPLLVFYCFSFEGVPQVCLYIYQMCMKKHFSSVKSYNCFCWSLHNGCYYFTFFRLAQNVDVERQT